jgi:hypothetical protein
MAAKTILAAVYLSADPGTRAKRKNCRAISEHPQAK